MHTTDTPTHTPATTLAILAGPVVTAAGMALTPWETEFTTAAYQAALAADPIQAQWAAVVLTIGYALMGLTSLTILRRSGRAPRPLFRIAAVAAFLGATILPGMVSVDFYDLALAQSLDPAQAVAIADAAHKSQIGAVLHVLSGIGYVGGGLLVMVTAWRAGLVGGWAPALVAASFVLPGMVLTGGPGIILGSALVILAFAGVAVRLQRRARLEIGPAARDVPEATDAGRGLAAVADFSLPQDALAH